MCVNERKTFRFYSTCPSLFTVFPREVYRKTFSFFLTSLSYAKDRRKVSLFLSCCCDADKLSPLAKYIPIHFESSILLLSWNEKSLKHWSILGREKIEKCHEIFIALHFPYYFFLYISSLACQWKEGKRNNRDWVEREEGWNFVVYPNWHQININLNNFPPNIIQKNFHETWNFYPPTTQHYWAAQL